MFYIAMLRFDDESTMGLLWLKYLTPVSEGYVSRVASNGATWVVARINNYSAWLLFDTATGDYLSHVFDTDSTVSYKYGDIKPTAS